MSSPALVVRPEPSRGRLSDQCFAVVDVETSGLSPRRNRILQVAVVTVRADGTVIDRWSSTVRPVLGRVGPTHIHGFTRRSLRRAPKFSTVAPELMRRLDGAVFTAHNVRFDWAFVARSLRRAGYPVPDATRLCTMRLSRAVDPLATSHRLVDVTARQGVVNTQEHDALADADAAAAVLTGLLAAAGVDDVADLPAIRGCTTAWPSGPPLPRWKRWLHRATGRHPQPAAPPPPAPTPLSAS